MMEKGFLVDAVAEFVKGSVWRDTVTHFLETHYKRFLTDSESESKVNGYTLEQYDSFMAFKDRVERMLEGVVSDLSCSGEDLVEAIKENLKYESALSTEKRFCIQTLLTFDDYDAFYSRIREYATEKQGVRYDENADGNAEISEWALQEAIARSILKAHARGQLDEAEAIWLPWAQAFVQMSQATASSEELAVEESEAKAEAKVISENDPEDKEDTRMHELEKILIRERFKVDLLVAQRIADANTQMKKQMLNLAAEVVNQDEQVDDVAISAEEELARLFKHIKTIGDRLKDVKIRCFKFESVTQQQMDTIYLYLKEKVHYKQDLVSQEKEIAAFIFMQIHEKDESLVPLILEWLLLESEQLRTQTQIQEHLAGPRDEGYWTQEWDESSQAFYYVNSESKESVWEPPAAGFYDINNEFHVPGLEIEIANDEAQETPYTEGVYNPESATDELPTLEQASSQLDATFELTIGPDATEMAEMESVLERISREHDQERKRLELVFELEKARQKEELRKRKEKKRREKLAKKQRQKDDASKGDGEASAQSPTSSHVAEIIDVKSEDTSHLNINVPGHGRIDLAHLLSDAHATRHRQLKGISPAHERVMLNPATLRYLTEQMAIKQPDVLGQQVRREIVLEEAADSK
ncbi:WW domain-containing protein [Phytophthora infestans]|uniref:Cilia- and flagella-associated protein 36 n=1 Tax=Phytophthora infestans TaxID=4787 RepID=A0A8S9UN38_PHYIN|nr:WW domain-containing protein [Phytophthora infestans]